LFVRAVNCFWKGNGIVMRNIASINRIVVALSILFVALLPPFQATAKDDGPDSAIKSWTTAELLGAMRWAKAEASDSKAKLDFSAAEIVCYKRLQSQIDSGSIRKSSAFLIAENVRKTGVYKREKLTLERADEMRRRIIGGRIFEKLTD
jgi:hypothetical protein